MKKPVRRKVTHLDHAIHVFKREAPWEEVEQPETVATIAHALGKPTRLTILDILDEGPVREVDLVRKVGCRVSTLRSHLEILEKANLVEHAMFHRGRIPIKMIYRVTDVGLRMRKRRVPEIFLDHSNSGARANCLKHGGARD